MPITRSAFQRYRLIDEAISRFPYQYSKKRLFELCQERCGIRSISSLEKDIQTLRYDHQAPIAYCKKRNGYYYSNPSFRLLKLMLTPDDMEAFEQAGEVLKATMGAASVKELMDALLKVRQNLDLIREVTSEPVSGKALYSEGKAQVGNRQYISVLIRAINNLRIVTFDYKKHESKKAKSYRVHPVKLREVRDSWYLIGYDEIAGHEKTFGLDRMNNLDVTVQECNVPEEVVVKIDQLFEHVYGITHSSGKVEEIYLSFTPLRGKYIKAKPIHLSQEEVEDSDSAYVIKLRLVVNNDLLMVLRSYGADMKILKPQSLIDSFTKDAEAMLAQYSR